MKRTEAGFTLVELMISLVIFSLAIAGVLSVAVSMAQGFREQRQAVATGDNVRASMDFIADAIRSASPAVQTGAIRDDATCTTLPTGGISVVDSTSGPDQLTLAYASGGVVTSTRSQYLNGTTTLTVTDATNISVGDRMMITDLNTGDIATVTAVNLTGPIIGVYNQGTLTVTSSSCVTTTYPAGSLAIRVVRARFYIALFDGNANTLMMDNGSAQEPLAENVEDFQVAVGWDLNNGTAPTNMSWQFSSAGGVTSTTLRAVRLTLVVRAQNPLQGIAAPFLRPAAEDHPASTTFDAYRRRVLTSTVEIRNLGGSP